MGKPTKPLPVKLISGLIFKEPDTAKQAQRLLEKHFGIIDFESKTLDFTYTGYYEKEFGSPLKRKFIGFKKLVLPQGLARIKITANRIESKLSKNGRRLVNIDPGYLDCAKFVLASTKDYKHRIYLGKGIYAEITLFYQDKTFRAWEWTYPDYKTPEYAAVFNQIRQRYYEQIKLLGF